MSPSISCHGEDEGSENVKHDPKQDIIGFCDQVAWPSSHQVSVRSSLEHHLPSKGDRELCLGISETNISRPRLVHQYVDIEGFPDHRIACRGYVEMQWTSSITTPLPSPRCCQSLVSSACIRNDPENSV